MPPAWDSYGAYLFDIDGTLLHCHDAVHYFGFCKALTSVAGRPLNLDGVITQGNVDLGIVRDVFARAQVPEDAWRPHVNAIRDELCQYVEDHACDFHIEVLLGVRQTLAHLRVLGADIGVATGNLERVGWAKLEACGLKSAIDFGCFSDFCENRTQVFAGALAKVKARKPLAQVCVLGDTPADVSAARANGLDVIAVSTGTYSYEQLQAAKPDQLLRSMNDLRVATEPTGWAL